MAETIILCGLGGFIYNVLPLLELAKVPKSERPDFKDWLYWLPFVCWPVLAALLGYVYAASGNEMTPILALNVGISAPLIFRAMLEANPFDSQTHHPAGNTYA